MTDTEEIKRCVLAQLPLKWQRILSCYSFSGLEEIRFRIFLPVMLYYNEKKVILEQAAEKGDMETILAAACKNSVYAYRESIAKGFITLAGGHRMGLSGRGVVSGESVNGLCPILGINIRIARQIDNCAKGILKDVIREGSVKNTLIISPPAAGKTTLLRELAKELSERFKVCVIDERSEIAAASADFKGFDLGLQTDVLDLIPKKEGITMALRSLSPEVIITDEIDTEEDIGAVKNILGAGAKIITSAHCEDFSVFLRKKNEFLRLFDTVIVLSRRNGAGTVEEVVQLGEHYA